MGFSWCWSLTVFSAEKKKNRGGCGFLMQKMSQNEEAQREREREPVDDLIWFVAEEQG